MFAIAWPLRERLKRPLALMWLVVGLFAVGRFFEFFRRSDSADLVLGLEIAQWTSLVLLAVAVAGAWLTLAHRADAPTLVRRAPLRPSAVPPSLRMKGAAREPASRGDPPQRYPRRSCEELQLAP